MLSGSTGSRSQFRSRSSFGPWYRPQSTRTRARGVAIRKRLPVTVPAAPGFFGTLELAFVISLRPFAVDESGALAAAVFFHVIPFIAATLAGWYFLSRAGVRLRDVAGETRE